MVATLENIFGSVKIYLFEKKIKALSQLECSLHKPIDLVIHKNFEREIEKRDIKKQFVTSLTPLLRLKYFVFWQNLNQTHKFVKNRIINV